MGNLTTATRFKLYAGITGSTQDSLITALLPQVSAAVEDYLRRTLESTTYKSWLDGTGSPYLRVNQYPILAIYQVSTHSSVVARIENTSSTVVRATVSFDGTSLSLTEISTSGTVTTTDIAVATYKTLTTLKTQIETVSGWTCTIASSEWNYEPTALLRPIYAQDAFDQAADLIIPDDPDPVKVAFEDQIEITSPNSFPDARQSDIAPVTFSYGFPEGTGNIFVWFKAGYSLPADTGSWTFPPGLELIVHQIMQDVLSSTKLNANLSGESIGDYSYSLRSSADGTVASAVQNHAGDLNAYKRISI